MNKVSELLFASVRCSLFGEAVQVEMYASLSDKEGQVSIIKIL